MYFPIKIRIGQYRKASFDLSYLSRKHSGDPTQTISKIRVGRVFKTSQRNRFPLLVQWLRNNSEGCGCVIDVAASNGVASIDLCEVINPKLYFITDRFTDFTIKYYRTYSALYLRDEQPVLVQGKYFIYYLDVGNTQHSPFEKITTWLWGRILARAQPQLEEQVHCVDPEIANRSNVRIRTYDILEPWEGPKGNVIIVANLLNKYTNDDCFINKSKENLMQALDKNGLLVVAENGLCERVTILRKKEDTLMLESRINGGSIVEERFLSRRL